MKSVLSFLGLTIFSFTIYCSISLATSFAPMSLKERVRKSNAIVVAKILKVRCLTDSGAAVAAGEYCTHPDSTNKLTYNIEIQDILFQGRKLNPQVQPKQILEFGFTAASHWTVPQDNYASQIGVVHVFFLRETQDGRLGPLHEAFFIDTLKDKNAILKEIKFKKSAVKK